MAVGEWFAQVYPAGGGKPQDRVYFHDFTGTLSFVKAFRSESSGGRVRVHVPAKATEEQRQELIDEGAALT
jgi:hypothetical protein